MLLLIGGVLVSSTSCGDSVPLEQPPKLSEELNIYSWWDYLDPSVIEDFERKLGVKVNLSTYADEKFMLSVIQSNPGKYDLVFPTESLVGEMIQLKLLEPLDLRHIPNIKNIDPRFLNLPYDPGNGYSVPYLLGTTGIAVNTKYVAEKIDSWGILWDPQYSGKISMLNNMYAVIGLTLKYLGYSLNSTELSELEEAMAKLREQRSLLQGYLDPETCIERLVSGELWLAQAYNGDALAAREENPDIAFVIPKEGADYYMDCMAIPRDAPHKYAAEVFIDFILRPEVHAQ
ncbi:MAG: spermidine/putrescine ABC transporter substrate-binding protein, partial [Chloroflexi bacterium CG07_land_8_20_14_0_80_51_10]